jgi:hypothetical protein
MISDITFENILDPKKFLKIQNQFMYFNVNLNNPVDYFKEVQKDDFGYNMESIFSELSNEENNNEKHFTFFYKHILMYNLNLDTQFIIDYTSTFKELEMNYGNVNLFYKQNIHKLIGYNNIMENVKHLRDDIKEIVKDKIAICIDKIQSLNNLEVPFLGEKMLLKLKRQDVLVLFYLLREKGILRWHNNAELKILLENNFKSYNSDTKEFLDIQIGRNVFSDFKNGSRAINPSLEKLKSIFHQENFFNID